MVLYRMEAGVRYPEHRHPHPEYGTVILGRCQFLVDGASRELNEGDSYFIPANVPHAAVLPPQPNPLVFLHVVVGVDGPPVQPLIDQMISESHDALRPEAYAEPVVDRASPGPTPPARDG